jgi:plastocyanin
VKTKRITRGLYAGLFAKSLLAGVAWAAEHEIQIVQYTYTPAELTIKVGDTVTWINGEKRVSHSVLFNATGEESERFFPGERWSRKFDQPGRVEYRCGPHPEMQGVIVIEP